MAMVREKATKERILDAARRVFLKKGLMGARMQEVADEAGINKALLHCYFPEQAASVRGGLLCVRQAWTARRVVGTDTRQASVR